MQKRFESTDPNRRYDPMNKPGGRAQPWLGSYQDRGHGMSMDWHDMTLFLRAARISASFLNEDADRGLSLGLVKNAKGVSAVL